MPCGKAEPILPVFSVPGTWLWTFHSYNSSGEKTWGNSPLKRGCLLAKKEQLITVMVTRYSCVLDILKDPAKSFKVHPKWIESRWWEERLQESWESFTPDKRGFDRCQTCYVLGCWGCSAIFPLHPIVEGLLYSVFSLGGWFPFLKQRGQPGDLERSLLVLSLCTNTEEQRGTQLINVGVGSSCISLQRGWGSLVQQKVWEPGVRQGWVWPYLWNSLLGKLW